MSAPEEDGEGPPTERTSGSYLDFRREAEQVAATLDRTAFLTSKRLDLVDRGRSTEMVDLAKKLRAQSEAFGRWPELDREAVHLDRARRVPELLKQLKRALALLESVPKMGSLGPVRGRR